MKAVGAKAIITALQANNCVNCLNLSHDDIRSEFVSDLQPTRKLKCHDTTDTMVCMVLV